MQREIKKLRPYQRNIKFLSAQSVSAPILRAKFCEVLCNNYLIAIHPISIFSPYPRDATHYFSQTWVQDTKHIIAIMALGYGHASGL